MDYFSLFERLTELMSSLDGFDIPAIFATLAEICKLLNVSKGVTTFYPNLEAEQKGQGEPFVCYDSGEKHVLASHLRFVSPAMVPITCDVYQAEGAAPLTEEQRRRVETIQRMMVTYMNRTRQEQIIEHLRFWDDEGYHNLRYFFAQIMKYQAMGKLGEKTAVRLNLKHFSLINERVGKDAGDLVLRKYAQALAEEMGPDAVIGRLGGDNFVCLFDTARINEVEECLQGELITYDEANNQRVEVSAAAGVYSIPPQEVIHNPGEIMERILAAYQVAKRENTSDIVFYTEEFKAKKEQEIRIQRKFDLALKNEEFQVYYQPKVDIKTREIIGAEALCRWFHQGRMIPPMDFIPALERGSDICRLDFYMLDHVCQDIRRWLDAGKPVVKVSVNLSRRHMIDPDLFEHLVGIIDKHHVPHHYIEIELTETTTDVEFRDLKRVVSELQLVGISTSVDDFGIGYSSLNLLKQIPWDVLKLDKSIIPAQGEDIERGSRMFSHVIAMAHEIGMKCVAEGIETEEQLEIMRKYGCRVAQGFLFDRPLPVAEFEQRMEMGIYACPEGKKS